MATTLTPAMLAIISAEAIVRAAAARYVDPRDVSRLIRVLRGRGEPWAASVLARPLTRRAVTSRSLPWLTHPELLAILAADQAEGVRA